MAKPEELRPDPITAIHQAARARWNHVPRHMAEAEEALRDALNAADFEMPLSNNRRFIQSAYGSMVDSLSVIGINEQNHSRAASLNNPVNIAGIPGKFQFSFGFKKGVKTAAKELVIVRKSTKGPAEYVSLCCDGTAIYKLIENDFERESAELSNDPVKTMYEDLLVRKIKDLEEPVTRSLTSPDLHPVEMRERFKVIRSNLLYHFRAIGVLPKVYDPNVTAPIRPIKIPGAGHSWEVYLAEDPTSVPYEKAQHGIGLFIENSVINKRGRHIKAIRQYILWENGHALYFENGDPTRKLELKLAEDGSITAINNSHLLLAKFAYLENRILVPKSQSLVKGLINLLRF